MTGRYLSQAFVPDAPGTQVFLAPGQEEQPWVRGPSPWILGRLVRVPGRYWHRLLVAIADGAPTAAALLDSWSGSPDPDDIGEQRPDPAEVAAVRLAVRDVTTRLRAGHVVSDEELEALGPYTREDMAAMGDAVMLVIDEAAMTRSPFSAWME